MLLDAASKVISMAISGRLQQLMKEVGTGGAVAPAASSASVRL
jgi:hypothetical protein